MSTTVNRAEGYENDENNLKDKENKYGSASISLASRHSPHVTEMDMAPFRALRLALCMFQNTASLWSLSVSCPFTHGLAMMEQRSSRTCQIRTLLLLYM